MATTCPRCESAVPDQALYCPYCNLPKPKAGFAAAPRQKIGEPKPASESGTAPARQEKSRGAASRSRSQMPARRLRLPVLIGAGLVALLSVGAYIYVVPMIRSDGADPKVALSTLDKFRRMPSNDASLTVEARMSRELDRSKRSGSLVSYQGWTTQRVKGSKTKVLLVFSYQETGGVQQRAEWVADLTSNAFTPQTELAAAVFGKQ